MAVAVQAEMATPPVARFGTDAQKRRFLAPAISGEAIASIAMTEPDAGSDLASMRTVARRYGDEYVINGRKTFITNGRRCHWCLLVAKTDTEAGHKGFSLFLVPKETPGFQVARTLKKLGMHSSDTAELVFEDCRLPAGFRLGDDGAGWTELMWELQGERLIAACGEVAGARSTFEYAMQYAKDRVAFGRPIAQFQVIKHRLVDLANDIAAVQALVYETCRRWDQGEYAVREISQSKLLASQLSVRVADEAIQVLGGHGYMAEFPVERAWRDARLSRIGAGTDEIMKEIIAKSYGL
jgi:alkylation response protein AidB-like acyl-CoA dehydrogenase